MVRFWWLSSAALFLICLWFITQQVIEYFREEVLTKIPAIPAVITDVNGTDRAGAKFTPDTPCTLSFDVNGQKTIVTGTLNGANDYITPGQKVMLHVNPANPSEWTDLDAPQPLIRRMITGITILPPAIAAGLAAIIKRRGVIRNWRDAPAIAYSALDAHHSALAPLCNAVAAPGCRPRKENRHRLSSRQNSRA